LWVVGKVNVLALKLLAGEIEALEQLRGDAQAQEQQEKERQQLAETRTYFRFLVN
jgi:hypothetical protein